MTATPCPCGRPAPTTAYLCGTCVTDIWRALGDIPALVVELEVSMAKDRRWEYETSTSPSRETALPYNLAAARTLARLNTHLAAIARRCILTGVPTTVPTATGAPGRTSRHLAGWLLGRIDGIAAQPWAAEALTLVGIVAHGITVIDRPPEHTYAGPCDQCGHDLYAKAGKATVECRACELTYDLAQRREWLLAQVDDRLATASDISRALTSLAMPITAERIRQWKHRERLQVKAHDRRNHPLYRVGDVVDLLVGSTANVGA